MSPGSESPPDVASLLPTSAWRRLGAFAIDYLLIAVWLTLLTAAGFASRRLGLGVEEMPETWLGRLALQGLFFLVLTLPIGLYFALLEASTWQGTVGKRLLRLRVTARDGSRLGLWRSLLRSAVKFLPWEIGHLGIWQTPGQPFVDEPGTLSIACWILALLLDLLWIVTLFLANGRTPYDRLAGSRVVRITPTNPHQPPRTRRRHRRSPASVE
jgi:uncharacterized RDD family membrane protein YckC